MASDLKRKIGNYEILETLGKGGYSWVKKGLDDKSKKHVALKFMARADEAYSSEQAEQVRTEIKSLTQIRHDNVMKLYAYNLNAKYPEKDGKTIPTILLVLEYCPGGELFDILYYTDALDEKLARTYFQLMMKGIEACHLRGIAHRDLKPQNLLLDKNYNLKLTDFGLSKIMDESQTMKTSYVGTKGYQAPELIAGKSYGPSCDIFSAGVVLFILLTGYPPFEQGDKRDKWYRPIYKGQYDKFWHNHSGCGVPEACKDLLQRMLCYKPKNRITIEEIKKHPWVTGSVYEKSELKKALQSRHKKMVAKRKADANKQKEMFNSVKRDIPMEFMENRDLVAAKCTKPLFNTLDVPKDVTAFDALWRTLEIFKKLGLAVTYDKKDPLEFYANATMKDDKGDESKDCEFTIQAIAQKDEEDSSDYIAIKKIESKGAHSEVQYRKFMGTFMPMIMSDETFKKGFNEDGTERKEEEQDEKKEEPECEEVSPVV